MTKEMIISSTSHETRVAILEDDQVVEIFIEREHSRGVVGNVYKGRVSKVLPGMQSAFVDLGLERDAFLYVTDVISPTEESLEDDDDEVSDTVSDPPLADGAEAGLEPDTGRDREDASGEPLDEEDQDPAAEPESLDVRRGTRGPGGFSKRRGARPQGITCHVTRQRA